MTTTTVQFDNIPTELKRISRWVCWKYLEVGEEGNKRLTKVPLQISGAPASSTNPNHWTDFFSVQNACQKDNQLGAGFVFSPDDNLIGIDIDDCREPTTGELTEFAQNIIDNIQGYVEVSPSLTGVKIFTRASLQHAHVDHSIGFECYAKARFFTVTGLKLQGDIPTGEQVLTSIIPERQITKSGDDFGDYTPPLPEYDIHRVETEILSHFDPDCGYTEWLLVGQTLHHQFSGDQEALDLWDKWSSGSAKYQSTGMYSCETKWKTFKGSGATLRSLIFKVNQMKVKQALDNGEIILDNNVLANARTFLTNRYNTEEGFALIHYADDFYVYKSTHYEVIEEQTIRSELYKFLDQCKKLGRKGNIEPFNPTPSTVSAVLDGVKSLVHLQNQVTVRPPVWLEEYRAIKPPSHKLVSVQNGLYHLEDKLLLPHSLGFFTQNSLQFKYDPESTCPNWLKFLDSVWGDDPESIECLQEIFGYILSNETKQQKMFVFVGPKRSGKGTINRVLVELLGQHNTVAPELSELCDNFGLQPWLNKSLATFTDSRTPERDRSAIVSQLLRIVGNDTVTVNRKNRESWSGYLPTRIVMYSNELPALSENSGALTGRMIFLRMSRSFYGHEDVDLADKLREELSAIFNWAMEGNARRLARGGKFIQTETGKELLQTMEETSNPIASFIEDTLEFDLDGTVNKDDVFVCYSHWAIKRKLTAGSELSFKRRFLAAIQEHNITSDLDRSNGKRNHIYRGIKLNDRARAYINSVITFESEEY